jgi:hypothetical protein
MDSVEGNQQYTDLDVGLFSHVDIPAALIITSHIGSM